jgi:hypothetical protein
MNGETIQNEEEVEPCVKTERWRGIDHRKIEYSKYLRKNTTQYC